MNLQKEFPNYPRRDEWHVEAPYDSWHLIVSADDGAAYLWDMNGLCAGCEDFGGTEELDTRFRAWSEKHAVIFARQWETKDFTQFHIPDDEAEQLYQEGLRLCTELAAMLEGRCKTLDYRALNRPVRRFVMANPPDEPSTHKLV